MTPTPTATVTLRPAAAADVPFLREVFEASKPQLALLPDSVRDQLIDLQWRAQSASYATDYPNADQLVVEQDGCPVGRVIVDRLPELTTIVDIAVVPATRNRGIATIVLTRVLQDAGRARLHVAVDNPARRLYERLGFAVVEDAGLDLVMEWSRTVAEQGEWHG